MSLHGMEETEHPVKMLGSSALKPVKPVEWQRQQLTEAVPRGKAAVTVSPVVREEVGQKGPTKRVEQPSHLNWPIITPSHPLLSPFWAVCTPGHLSKILGSSPVQHRFPVMWKVTAVPLTLSVSAGKLALKARWRAKVRAGLPHPRVVVFYFYVKTEIFYLVWMLKLFL